MSADGDTGQLKSAKLHFESLIVIPTAILHKLAHEYRIALAFGHMTENPFFSTLF